MVRQNPPPSEALTTAQIAAKQPRKQRATGEAQRQPYEGDADAASAERQFPSRASRRGKARKSTVAAIAAVAAPPDDDLFGGPLCTR